jgi:hypothetical protein
MEDNVIGALSEVSLFPPSVAKKSADEEDGERFSGREEIAANADDNNSEGGGVDRRFPAADLDSPFLSVATSSHLSTPRNVNESGEYPWMDSIIMRSSADAVMITSLKPALRRTMPFRKRDCELADSFKKDNIASTFTALCCCRDLL